MGKATKRWKRCPDSCARALAVGLIALIALGSDADQPEETDSLPDLELGVSAGYSHHFTRTVEIDGISGATRNVEGSDTSDPGFQGGLLAHFALFEAGTGIAGISLHGHMTFPGPYIELGAMPRFGWSLPVESDTLYAVRPWLGLGAWFAFYEEFSKDFFLVLGPSLGCEFEVFAKDLVLGLAMDTGLADATTVIDKVEENGDPHEYKKRLKWLAFRAHLSYRLF